MTTNEEQRVGHILVSTHITWESVLNCLRHPCKTSINMFYNQEEGHWVVGRVMVLDEREEENLA